MAPTVVVDLSRWRPETWVGGCGGDPDIGLAVYQRIDKGGPNPKNTRPCRAGARRSILQGTTLANIKSAAKKARQAEKHRQHNAALRTRMRSAIKKTVKATQAGDATAASTALQAAVPQIDTMVSKGLVHRNKAARHKSRLNKAVKVLKAR